MLHKITDVLEQTEQLPAASRGAGAVTGATILDLSKYVGGLRLNLSVGTVAGGGTLDVKMQESDASDMSGATDVASGAFTQVIAPGFVQKDFRVRQFTKRYIRPAATVAVAAIVFSLTCDAQKRVQ